MDEIIEVDDQELAITRAHEFWRCKEAFSLFVHWRMKNPYDRDKRIRVRCHDAYLDFLSHLFEFYVSFFERDPTYSKKGKLNQSVSG